MEAVPGPRSIPDTLAVLDRDRAEEQVYVQRVKDRLGSHSVCSYNQRVSSAISRSLILQRSVVPRFLLSLPNVSAKRVTI